MAMCVNVGCINEALFSETCVLCSSGKLPSPQELIRNARKPPAPPHANFVGCVEEFAEKRHKLSAINIAGNSSDQDGGLTVVGIDDLKLHHQTTPRANYSIWYTRNVTGHSINVYGIGTHVGNTNKVYKVFFHNGKEKTIELA